jgi:hypothetical protein
VAKKIKEISGWHPLLAEAELENDVSLSSPALFPLLHPRPLRFIFLFPFFPLLNSDKRREKLEFRQVRPDGDFSK